MDYSYKIKGHYYTGSYDQKRAKQLVAQAKRQGYKAEMYVSRKNYKKWFGVVFWEPSEVKKLAVRRAKRKR